MMDFMSLMNPQTSLLSYAPYFFLALAIVSLWFTRHWAIWGSLLWLALLLGFFSQRIYPLSLLTVFCLGLGYYLSFHIKNLFFKIQFIIFSILISIAVFLHWMPGFNNLEVLHQIQLSTDSYPYSMYFNFDKPLVGLFILAFGFEILNRRWDVRNIKKIGLPFLWILMALFILLPVIGIFSGYVRWDPKWQNVFFLWAINNLLFVCVTEEACFRGFIQYHLQQVFGQWRFGAFLAVVIAALLFGLVHFKDGATYMALSALAGCFYGLAYLKTGRIEASILMHFLLNAYHLLLFSYPALAK